jgi:hypothetical protein
MSLTLQPPYLLIREGKAFWVESRPPSESSATLQAFEEGCFNDAWCYDATGSLWPIMSARLKRHPSFLQRVLPWRRVSVELQVGTPAHVDMAQVISRLAKVLQIDNEFCEYLPVSPMDILRRFETARTPGDIIGIARDCDELYNRKDS